MRMLLWRKRDIALLLPGEAILLYGVWPDRPIQTRTDLAILLFHLSVLVVWPLNWRFTWRKAVLSIKLSRKQ
jgi:hypothetical protein